MDRIQRVAPATVLAIAMAVTLFAPAALAGTPQITCNTNVERVSNYRVAKIKRCVAIDWESNTASHSTTVIDSWYSPLAIHD